MSYAMGIVYSNTAVDSTANTVTLIGHTKCIHFINTHASTNAVVKLNGGPHQVLIPAGKNYVEIEGDYTQFQVMTAGVTLAVYAIG
jgi:hypothetical protein